MYIYMFYFHENNYFDAAENNAFVKMFMKLTHQDILRNFIGENRRKSRHLITKYSDN